MTKNSFSRTPSDIFPFGVFELQVQYFWKGDCRIKLTSADEVAKYARENIYPEGSIEYVEQFYILLLDRSNQLLAWKQISVGGISATFIDLKINISDCITLPQCPNYYSALSSEWEYATELGGFDDDKKVEGG